MRLRSFAGAAVAAAPLLCLPCAGLAQGAAPEPRTRTTIDVGFVNASGNTSIRTLTAAEQFIFRTAPWKFSQSFNIVNGYTKGEETANNIRAGLRGDYAFSPHVRAYALVAYERNRFAGVARRFEEQVGLSYGALVGPTHVLDIEAGAGLNQQTSPSAAVIDYWLGRVAAHYRFTFRPNTYVDEKLELLQSLQASEERRINSEAVLVAPLSRSIALRFGYLVRFVNAPPVAVPAIKQTDQIVSSGIQIVF